MNDNKSEHPPKKDGIYAALARFVQRLFRGDAPGAGPKRQEYIKRGPTPRSRRGKKGNAGSYANRIARRRRTNEIAKESRRRNRR